MKIRLNVFQLVCALLAVLCYLVIPFAYLGMPGIRISLMKLTGITLWSHVSDWMLLPLLFGVVMTVVAIIGNQTASVIAGGITLVGTITLGVCLNSIIASSANTALSVAGGLAGTMASTLGANLSGLGLDVSSLVDMLSTAALTLDVGFYAFLLLTSLFILFAFVSGAELGGQRGRGHRATPTNPRQSGMYP